MTITCDQPSSLQNMQQNFNPENSFTAFYMGMKCENATTKGRKIG